MRYPNPRIRRQAPDLGQLRERVVIATTVERPDADVSTVVRRPGVIRVQARIQPIKDEQILDYLGVFGTELKPPSVEVTIRWPPDISIGINHWVYHQDKHTGIAVWYKVRTIEDLGGVHRWLVLNCSVDSLRDDRADPATQLPPPEWRTPADDEVEIDKF